MMEGKGTRGMFLTSLTTFEQGREKKEKRKGTQEKH